MRLAQQASLLGRLIRLLGDGGHCRDDISGVHPNSKLTCSERVGTVMILGKWKVENGKSE